MAFSCFPLLLLFIGSLLPSQASPQPSQHRITIYDERMAHIANMYSAIAYVHHEDVAKWENFGKVGCSKMTKSFIIKETFVADGDIETTAFGYIGVDLLKKKIMVVFRGTKNQSNRVQTLGDGSLRYKEICQVPTSTSTEQFLRDLKENNVVGRILKDLKRSILGRVHVGFCSYYLSLDPNRIINAIYKLKMEYSDYEVFFTGHSLGGAVASLAATHFGQTFPDINPTVYTFGEPRVGDFSFAKKFKEAGCDGFRVVNRNDVIPHLAFCCGNCSKDTTCPYHASTQIHYKEGMGKKAKFHICKYHEEDPECRSFPPYPSIADHKKYFDIHTGSNCAVMSNDPDESSGDTSSSDSGKIKIKRKKNAKEGHEGGGGGGDEKDSKNHGSMSTATLMTEEAPRENCNRTLLVGQGVVSR